MKLIALYTTVATREDAQRLATNAIERGLAACVQMTPVDSVYRWHGEVQQEAEIRLMFKTTQAAAPALKTLILDLHPYELPALYALDVAEANEPYCAWVEQNSRGASR